MDRIGAQEFLMPVMHPAELWQKSGRWELMGEELFRLKDRKGADFVLGMTHEEIISTLATEMESYRELPQLWYQFQTKLRDEPRPKAGLIRTREFTMKDSYSFDLDAAGLDVSFLAHRDAYVRISQRLAIPAAPADPSSPAMGAPTPTAVIFPSPPAETRLVRGAGSGSALRATRSSRTWPCAADAACSPAPTPTIPPCGASRSSGTSPWAGGPACVRWRPVTPASTAGMAWRSSAASRSGTSSSSATSTPTLWTSGCPARTASRSSRSWAATASASSAPWPRPSRSTTMTRASSGRSRSPPSVAWWRAPSGRT